MSNMKFGLDRMVNSMFRRVDGVVWDISTGKIGVQTDEGIATLDGLDAGDPFVNINMIDDFGIPIPAYAQSTAQADVKVGDIIVTGRNAISWVIERKETDNGVRFKTMKVSGDTGSWVPPKKTTMGFVSGTMILRPLINMFGGNQQSIGGMQSMMMMMAMFDDGAGVDVGVFDKIMPMMLMQSMQGGDVNGMMANPMISMMLMQQFMGGGNSIMSGGNGGGKGSGNPVFKIPNNPIRRNIE